MKIKKRKSGILALFMAAVLFAGCGKQESAAEELYAKDPSWIVQEENSETQTESEQFIGNQLSDAFQIHYLDVGQGDAALVICDGHAMLIDAGDNTKGTYVQNYLQKLDITYLDIVVATHPDADHIGGMDVVLQKFDCGRLLIPDVVKDTKTYEDVVNVIENKYINAIHPYTGDSYGLGSAQVTILSPYRDDYEDVNDFSIVCRITYGNTNFLFMGDAGKEIENEILQNGIGISADVIKVGHHGSKSSSGGDFIRAVGATSAVISCEENNEYGHPAAATLNTLRDCGVNLYRTDEQGTIVLYSDGNNITFNCKPSTTWQAGEYKGQNQSQEAPDGNSYNKYEDPQAFLKFQYDGKDKEEYAKIIKNYMQQNGNLGASGEEVIVDPENVTETMDSVSEAIKETADSAKQKTEDVAESTKENVKEITNNAGKTVKNIEESVPDVASKIGKAIIKANIEYWDEEHCPPNYGNIEDTMRIAKSALQAYEEMEESE